MVVLTISLRQRSSAIIIKRDRELSISTGMHSTYNHDSPRDELVDEIAHERRERERYEIEMDKGVFMRMTTCMNI